MKGILTGIIAFSVSTSFAQTEVLNEDFESGAPVAFTIVDNDGHTPNAATAQFTEAWTRMADPSDTSAITDTVMGSTSYFDPIASANRWLITPAITLGAYGNFLYWEARSHDPSYPDDYKVLVSTTDAQLSSFTDTIGLIQEEYSTWFSRVVNLSANGYSNQTVYVAFVNTTYDGFALYIDDIRAEIEDPVGLDEMVTAAVLLYPNPTSDFLHITSDSNIESIEIVSLTGASLQISNSTELDVSSLQSGSYFAKVTTSRGIVVRSFLKQ